MDITLNVSGFETHAEFPDQDIARIHRPLLEKFTRLYREKQERVVVFLCAPPGSGKSTLAAFWEHLSEMKEEYEPLQVLPFDGFHLPNDILDNNTTVRDGKTISLRSIKGSFETFNLSQLIEKLKKLHTSNPTWPFYDRNLHDPVDDAITVNKNIVVVEGNWLLLNEPVWQGLHKLADFSVFVTTNPDYLKARLVNRKIRGGCTEEQALAFYLQSDAINVDKVIHHSIPADLTLHMNADGSLAIQ